MPTARWNLIWMCVLVAVNQLGFGGVVRSAYSRDGPWSPLNP